METYVIKEETSVVEIDGVEYIKKKTCEMPMVFEDDEGNDLDDAPAYFRHYKCSNCGDIMIRYKYDYWFYCPNCGAKVVGD